MRSNPFAAPVVQFSEPVDLQLALINLGDFHKQGLWMAVIANDLARLLPKELAMILPADEVNGLVTELGRLGKMMQREADKGLIRSLFSRADFDERIHEQLVEIAAQLISRFSGAQLPDLLTL